MNENTEPLGITSEQLARLTEEIEAASGVDAIEAAALAGAILRSLAGGSLVQVRYPLTEEDADRGTWPWVNARIISSVGPDEWEVALDDGETQCFRDSSEIRPCEDRED